MDSKALEIFSAVARTGSVSRAAEELHYVQSNVSARIKQLEDELDTRLFHRQSRGVALTAAGRVLQGYADRVLHLVGEAEQAVRGSVEFAGSLKIGSLESTAAVRLPGVLAHYHKAYPQVDLSLKTGHTADLLDEVQAFKLDGVFVSGPVERAEIVQEPVFEEELVLVSAAGAAPDTPDAMLAFRHGCSYRLLTEQWLSENGQVPSQIIELGSLDAILACAAAGMGITLLPKSVVQRPQHREALRLEPLPEPMARATTVFARHKDTAMTPVMAALLDLAKEAAAAAG
ncbi:MAG: LysR substrate-binding domain-containing protein [Alphaproteobacteria bacterium]|nr:LysR substrate-binding domain-containing protein [Alphaproteobacteria bacterium]